MGERPQVDSAEGAGERAAAGPSGSRYETAAANRRLLLAVLQDAIDCYQKHAVATTVRGRRLFREVERWFLGRGRSAALSFEQVCSGLGLDPSYIRRGVFRWGDGEHTRRSGRRHPLLRRITTRTG